MQTAPISDGVLPGTIRQLVLEYDLIINLFFFAAIFSSITKELCPCVEILVEFMLFTVDYSSTICLM